MNVQKIWFWIKIIGIGLLVILAIFIGMKVGDTIEKVFDFFFKDEQKNKTIIQKVKKVKTDQGKTASTKEWLEALKKEYGI